MTNRRAKIAAGATVVGLAALGGVALGTNPGMPPASQQVASATGSLADRDQRQRRGRRCRSTQNAALAPDAAADRHPRQRRRPEPTSPRRTERDFEQAEILVVANRTADSPDLIAALRRRAAALPASFTLLVPGGPARARLGGRHEGRLVGGGRRAPSAPRPGSARRGLELDEVIVGDPDPFAAVGDVLHAREFDEVVVSTLPRAISRWLALGLPARLRRTIDLPGHPGDRARAPQPLPAGAGSRSPPESLSSSSASPPS